MPLYVNENAQDYRLEHRRDAQQILSLLHKTKLQGPRQGVLRSSDYALDLNPEDVELGKMDGDHVRVDKAFLQREERI